MTYILEILFCMLVALCLVGAMLIAVEICVTYPESEE